MRVTKRIEAYVQGEVQKIADVKRQAIRDKYAPKIRELEDFKKFIFKQLEDLENWVQNEMKARNYTSSRYSGSVINTSISGIYSVAQNDMQEELQKVSEWVNEQTGLICIKLEMGGDMETLASLLEELKSSL